MTIEDTCKDCVIRKADKIQLKDDVRRMKEQLKMQYWKRHNNAPAYWLLNIINSALERHYE